METGMGTASAGAGIVAMVVFLVAALFLFIIPSWLIYAKAGKPGWAAIVPIYNIVVLLDIIKKPTWWVILFIIPVVNFVIGIIMCLELAKSFGKSTGFGIGLIILSPIFYPILGYGKATYVGAK